MPAAFGGYSGDSESIDKFVSVVVNSECAVLRGQISSTFVQPSTTMWEEL